MKNKTIKGEFRLNHTNGYCKYLYKHEDPKGVFNIGDSLEVDGNIFIIDAIKPSDIFGSVFECNQITN